MVAHFFVYGYLNLAIGLLYHYVQIHITLGLGFVVAFSLAICEDGLHYGSQQVHSP